MEYFLYYFTKLKNNALLFLGFHYIPLLFGNSVAILTWIY